MQSQATARRGQENELTIAVEFSATLPGSVTFRFACLSRFSELAVDLNADSLDFTFPGCSDISRAVERKIEGGSTAWQPPNVPNAEILPVRASPSITESRVREDDGRESGKKTE